MRLHFISYANEKHSANQDALAADVRACGAFDTIYSYQREWLETTPFYRAHQELLDLPRGNGYWVWKPLIILDALDRATPGDIVVYMDSGDAFTHSDGLRTAFEDSVRRFGIGLRVQGELNHHMTKRDCFVLMGCDEKRYWNAKQVEAGLVAVRRAHQSVDFIQEWLAWCCDPRVVTDADNVCGLPNFPEFIDHRHDQSILTNIAVRHGITVDAGLCNWLAGNERQPV